MSYYRYQTRGTCSAVIDFALEEGKVKDVHFTGGCDGNLKVISKLVDGMPAKDVINKCKGICCGMKKTSCGDQLATAIEAALEADKEDK